MLGTTFKSFWAFKKIKLMILDHFWSKSFVFGQKSWKNMEYFYEKNYSAKTIRDFQLKFFLKSPSIFLVTLKPLFRMRSLGFGTLSPIAQISPILKKKWYIYIYIYNYHFFFKIGLFVCTWWERYWNTCTHAAECLFYSLHPSGISKKISTKNVWYLLRNPTFCRISAR